MSRILVAGPGYVGMGLAESLAHQGHEVYGLQRSFREHSLVKFIQGDLGESPIKGLPTFDEVFFCLAPKSRDLEIYRRTFISAQEKLLSSLPKKPQFYGFISSTAVYPQIDGEEVEEDTRPERDHTERGDDSA